MPETNARSNTSPDAPEADRLDQAAFVAAVGRLVRLSRAKRGMTRRQLAQDSGASERYLAQIESGQGNPSVIILKSIAEALEAVRQGPLPTAAISKLDELWANDFKTN